MSELSLKFFPAPKALTAGSGFPDCARLGRIVLSIVDRGISQTVLDVHWDVDELLVWFRRNEFAITKGTIPDFVQWKESIKESIERVYDDFDSYRDDQLDELFEYRRCHEICFGLRGVSVPTLYIGVGKLGAEISGEYDGSAYCHYVNLSTFFASLREV